MVFGIGLSTEMGIWWMDCGFEIGLSTEMGIWWMDCGFEMGTSTEMGIWWTWGCETVIPQGKIVIFGVWIPF